jgi:hypothetical protein
MFLINPLDLIGLLFGLAFAYPWALILLPAGRRSWLALALTTLALSLGALTLWMMALALLDALTFGAVIAGVALAFGATMLWILGTQTPYPKEPAPPLTRRIGAAARERPLFAGAVIVTLGIAALIALNALYWPFNDSDAVAIYAEQSRVITRTGEFPSGEGLYEAYPMLLPLSYTYSYMLAGEIDEYLARVVVAALALGTIGAAFELGRALYDEATALSAATLLALTPTFARWASSGYADIPAAFFATMALLFAARLARSGDARDALLLGIMAGLSAWTKNSALPLVGSLAVWLITWQRSSHAVDASIAPTKPPQRALVRIALAGMAVTAGPWYLRNLLLFGHVVPRTVWTEQAERTLTNLVPFLTHPDHFSAPGIVFTLGIALAVYEAWRGGDQAREGARLLLIAALPLAAAWWWMASYDTRFLLVILPIFAVMGGRLLVRAWQRIGSPRRVAYQVALLAVIVALALPSARKAVIFKGDMARDPFMGDVKRHRISVGPVYDVARYLNALPAEGRILSDTTFLPFYVNREGKVEVIVGGLPQRDTLAEYDFLVTSKGRRLPRAVQPEDVEQLIDLGGARVYRVLYR